MNLIYDGLFFLTIISFPHFEIIGSDSENRVPCGLKAVLDQLLKY